MVRLLLCLLFKTPWEGAQTLIHASVARELEGVSGEFLRDCGPTPFLTPPTRDPDTASKLWTISSQLVGLQ